MDKKPEGKQVANDLMDMMNVLSSNGIDEKAFVDAILNSHRTLQQSACGLLLQVFAGWAEMKDKGYYDLRNQATVDVAKRVTAAAEEAHLPMI